MGSGISDVLCLGGRYKGSLVVQKRFLTVVLGSDRRVSNKGDRKTTLGVKLAR